MKKSYRREWTLGALGRPRRAGRAWWIAQAVRRLDDDVEELRDALLQESEARTRHVQNRYAELWARLDAQQGEIEALRTALGADT